MSIAEQLNGREAGTLFLTKMDIGKIVLEVATGIHTFEDGSRAKLITKVRLCAPKFIHGITTSVEEYQVWEAL